MLNLVRLMRERADFASAKGGAVVPRISWFSRFFSAAALLLVLPALAAAQNGTITGTVTRADGTTPIQGINVQAVNASNNQVVGNANTTSTGTYTISVGPGSYAVRTNSSQPFINEFHPNISCGFGCQASAATLVIVTSNTATPNINFALDPGGQITGVISGPNGPLNNINVEIFTTNNVFVASAGTGTNNSGVYLTSGLPAGNYFVRTQNANNQGLINELYDNVVCLGTIGGSSCPVASATQVPVTVGATTSGISLQLAAGGSITGTITNGSTNAPVQGINLSIDNAAGNFLFGTSTNALGVFTVGGLPTGNYRARTTNATFASPALVDEVYNDIACIGGCNSTSGTPISVTAPNPTSSIDFALALAGSITGTVRRASDNTAIASVNVQAVNPSNGQTVASANTNSSGVYTINVPAGNYNVRTSTSLAFINKLHPNISCAFGCQLSAGTQISVTSGTATPNIDFSLDAGGQITGVITGPTGTPLNNINVEVYTANNIFVTSAGTGNNNTGVFLTPGLATGTFYVRTQNANNVGLVNEIFDNATCLGGAGGASCSMSNGTPVQVTIGQTTSGINMQLAQGGTITGTITNSSTSNPIQGVNVSVSDATGNQVVFSQQTTANGVYTAGGLPTGTYYIRTQSSSTVSPAVIDELHNNIPCVGFCTATTGTAVQVTAPSATTIDFALDPGARISGTITNAVDGSPLVNVQGPTGGMNAVLFNASFQRLSSMQTNASGAYSSAGLQPGTYYVATENSQGFINEIFDDVPCAGQCNSSVGATPITLTAGESRTGVNFGLTSGGRIRGTVTAADGTPLGNINVQVFDAAGQFLSSGNTDGQGVYTIAAGLRTGTYYLRTGNSQGYINEIYNDIPCVANCQASSGAAVTVTTGETTDNINFVLARGGRVSGTVTDTNGALLPGVNVEIYDASNARVTSGFTNSQGVYITNEGLPTGTYYARTSNGLGFINRIYNDLPCTGQCQATGGTAITVTAGQTTPNINFSLPNGGRFTGVVTNADGALLGGVTVQVYDAFGNFISNFVTNSAGRYSATGLPTGIYFARTSNGAGYVDERYNNTVCIVGPPGCAVIEGTGISVTVGQVTENINFELALGGRISGTVTAAGGGAIAGVSVRIYNAQGFQVTSLNTNGSGAYLSAPGLPPGQYYVNTFNRLGFIDEAYNNVVCLNCTPTTGTAVTVTGTNTIANINLELASGAQLRGRVIGPNNTPLVNVTVRVLNRFGTQLTTAFTNPLGNYVTAGGLPAGEYYLATSNLQGYIDERHDGSACLQCTVVVTEVSPITIPATGAPPEVNFDLAIGGRVRGVVRGPDNVLLSNVNVNIVDSASRLVASGFTNSLGQYITGVGLPTGTYYAKTFNSRGFLDELYDNSPCPTCAASTGTPITVNAGETTNDINFDLVVGGRISGRVMIDGTSTPIPNVTISVLDANGSRISPTTTNAAGNWISTSLPTGTYYVKTTNAPGYIDETYDNLQCVGNCTVQAGRSIAVTVGETTANINFGLAAGGRISGTVVSGTTPLANVTVNIFNAAGSSITSVNTNGSGQYQTIVGLPAGVYYARTNNSLGYINKLHSDISCPGTCTVTNGARITLTAASPNATVNFDLAAGGRIAGTVRDANNQPLQNVQLNIFSATGQRITGATTNTAGQYITLDGLGTGNYFVGTSNSLGLIDERYDGGEGIACGSNCSAGIGLAVAVTSPNTTSNINFTLAAGGRVAGRVTDATTTNGLRSVSVDIFAAGGPRMTGGFTDALGRYIAAAGLPAGRYYARTNNSQGYIDLSSAEFTVTPGVTTPDVDLALSRGAQISGRITNAATGDFIPGVFVNIFDAANFNVASTSTGADGRFVSPKGLAPGTYYVRTSNNLGYVDELFDDRTCLSCRPSDSTPIVITGTTNRDNVDFALAVGGSIAGRITDAAGNAIAGVNVNIFTPDGRSVRSGRSDDTGRYEAVGLPAGTYYARTGNNIGFIDKIYNNIACAYGTICPVTTGTAISVTAATTTPDINFALTQGGRIAGVITDTSNNPIGGAFVSIYDSLGRQVVGTAPSDASGRYITGTGLPDGTYYAIANANGYLREQFSERECFPNCIVTGGTAIAVTTASTTPANVNFTLAPGGRIAGRVTDATTGNPLANIHVVVGQAGSTTGLAVASTNTDSSGRYVLGTGLAAGNYRVRTGNSSGRINEVYNDITCVTSAVFCPEATNVPVTVGQTTPDINFSLASGARIRGQLTDRATGAPLPGVLVLFFNSVGNLVYNAASTTDIDGRFESLAGVPDGTYFAATRNFLGYVDQVYDGIDCISARCDVTRGTAITISGGVSAENINFALARGGQISGRVSGNNNGTLTPLPNVTIEIYGSTGILLTSFLTDAAGNYAMFGGLPTGDYFVKTVNSLGYVDELYDNLLCVSCEITRGTTIAVTAGSTTTNINFELGQGGLITGTIYDASNNDQPLADAPVSVSQCPGGASSCQGSQLRVIARTTTDANGVYSVSLPPGTYFVKTDAIPGYSTTIYRAPSVPGGRAPIQPCPLGLCDPSLGSAIEVSFGASIGQINLGVTSCAPITVNPVLLPIGSLGTAYLQTLSASGGAAPYGFAITEGQLPPGLTLNATTGVISGSTTAAGSTSFTIAASDANGCSGTRVFNPTICSIDIGSTSANVSNAAGSGSLSILAVANDCPWTAASDASWLTIAATSGAGNASVTYSYQARGAFTQPRTGTIAVGANAFRVTQAGVSPTFVVTPATATFRPTAGSGIVQVTANAADAGWTATTNVPWVTLSAAGGTGTGSTNFIVARNNTQTVRTGNIFAAGQTVIITQEANGIPGEPANLTARVTSGRARFTWGVPLAGGDATSYLLDVGVVPGQTLMTFPTPDATTSYEVPPTIPPGSYYFRVRAQNEFGIGAPSEDYRLVVGTDGTNPPGAPLNLVATVTAGGVLNVTWDAPASGGTPTGYLLEVGSASGVSDLATLPLTTRSFTYNGVPPGNFFLRVRAVNGAGASDASHEVLLNAGGVPSPPGPPTAFVATASGSAVSLSWQAPTTGGAATSYVLEAGTARGLANLATVNVGSGTSVSFPGVPPGVYYLRLRAQNAQGISIVSNEVRLVVP